MNFIKVLPLLLSLSLFFPSRIAFAQNKDKNKTNSSATYTYTYIEKEQSFQDKLIQLGGIYALSWAAYRITQPTAFTRDGSTETYKNNFGKMVFDNDEPVWNWMVHSLSGGQIFLLYRAMGHSRSSALGMLFVSSTLFEFTVEIYTEPASIQDLYQTPVFGSILGIAIENLSFKLLNSNTYLGKFFGHLINPSTLFWFYEGRVKLVPQLHGKRGGGITLMASF